MKKLLLSLALMGFMSTQAQVSFKPGVKAGYSSSTLNAMDADYRNDFYIGAFGSLNLTKVYSMQFELMYLRQGVNNYSWLETGYDGSGYTRQNVLTEDIHLNYISLNFINKFKFDKFNIHAGPGLDIKVNKDSKILNDYSYTYNSYYGYYENSDIDLTFNIGLGYNFTPNLALDLRMRQGLIEPVYGTNSYSAKSNLNRSFQLGLSYMFK